MSGWLVGWYASRLVDLLIVWLFDQLRLLRFSKYFSIIVLIFMYIHMVNMTHICFLAMIAYLMMNSHHYTMYKIMFE